jgi:hypothetical protein
VGFRSPFPQKDSFALPHKYSYADFRSGQAAPSPIP